MFSYPLLLFLFIFVTTPVVSGRVHTSADFLKVKKEVTNLVLISQRNAALTLINDELKLSDGDYKLKLNDLKFNVLTQFLSLASQEAYEAGASLILSDKKKALGHLQTCLKLEPENIHCQWLELKYLKRYNTNSFPEKAGVFIETTKDLRKSLLQKYSLNIALGHLQEVPSQLRIKAGTPEEEILLSIINFRLAIQTDDYFRAKEALTHFENHANDFPDLIYMNYEMANIWPEKNGFLPEVLEKQNEVYKKKCADLPTSTARKYFFDIALCTRSLN